MNRLRSLWAAIARSTPAWCSHSAPVEEDVTALAKALFEVGLTSIGPDDLDNRQIAARLLSNGYVRVIRP